MKRALYLTNCIALAGDEEEEEEEEKEEAFVAHPLHAALRRHTGHCSSLLERVLPKLCVGLVNPPYVFLG